jgi:hypothetical protein
VQGNLHARFGEGRLEKGRCVTSLAAYSTMAAPTLICCGNACSTRAHPDALDRQPGSHNPRKSQILGSTIVGVPYPPEGLRDLRVDSHTLAGSCCHGFDTPVHRLPYLCHPGCRIFGSAWLVREWESGIPEGDRGESAMDDLRSIPASRDVAMAAGWRARAERRPVYGGMTDRSA